VNRAASPHWFSGALFIMANTIGTSFLYLPPATAMTGFVPGLVMSLLIWLFITAIGLLYAEAVLTTIDGSNLISIARTYFGKFWMWIFSIVFCFSMYAYLTSYFYYSSQSLLYFVHLPPLFITILLAILFGGIVALGINSSNKLNYFLCAGLFVSFIYFVIAGSPHVNSDFLSHEHWIFVFLSVPILFSALGFASFVPSLCSYLNRDEKKIRLAILIGTFIALIMYILWQWIIVGSVPSILLQIIYEQQEAITPTLAPLKQISYFPELVSAIIFFAATTSILTTGLLLVDFFSDGLHIPLKSRVGWKRTLLCLLIFFPPILVSQFLAHHTMNSIRYIAIPIGQVLINGVIPLFLAILVRHHYHLVSSPLVPGGKWTLIALSIALFFIIYMEAIQGLR
jgi:tyrosine-specific transport protein